jgi:hypothetical protein
MPMWPSCQRMVDDNNQDEETAEEVDEPATPEVVEAEPANHEQSEEFDRIATYTVKENGVKYQISPNITRTGAEWKLWAFGSGQGPLQFPEGITDEQAEHLGLSPSTQANLNDTLREVRVKGKLPPEFRGQPRDSKTIDELQESLGM